MTTPLRSGDARRSDPLLPNAWIVAKREYLERIRSRLFYASTLLLATLAVLVAFAPVFVRLVDRGTSTTIAVQSPEPALVQRSINVMSGVLNATAGGGRTDTYDFVKAPPEIDLYAAIQEGTYDGAILAVRDSEGRIDFTFLTGEGIAADRTQLVGIGALGVAILDWTAANDTSGGPEFQIPTVDVIAAAGPTAGGAPIGNAEFASRRIIGIVFVVLIFITLVIYGMWVAAGVVAEKASRVMELLISAASPRQLVIGKVVGIGLAGLTQYVGILVPAFVALAVEDRVAIALLGPSGSIAPSLSALTPALLGAYGLFFVLGFVLYSLIYAAAGSLVSRQEDLQILALPLSLIAIVGYLEAVLALSGGTSTIIRLSSYVPFWSPFVMLTRLTVARVEPWELVLAYGLLIVAISIVVVIAVRVYAAGVLLYGQRPGLRAIVGAIVRPV
ncbi:MAG TPA: ABC transporter permease [Candidatus Polarisedimenticolia bacterium]|nr:ABC transporter permease [Candidatus Polarisedimenticolia bacterium]